MNAIVDITSLMAHENGLSDKMQGYIHKVQLSNLLSLINDVLDMSKIESCEVTLNQVDNIVRPQGVDHRQHFTIQTDEIVHEYLIGDSMRLRQSWLNLLINAVKYTPEGGDILTGGIAQRPAPPGQAALCRDG